MKKTIEELDRDNRMDYHEKEYFRFINSDPVLAKLDNNSLNNQIYNFVFSKIGQTNSRIKLKTYHSIKQTHGLLVNEQWDLTKKAIENFDNLNFKIYSNIIEKIQDDKSEAYKLSIIYHVAKDYMEYEDVRSKYKKCYGRESLIINNVSDIFMTYPVAPSWRDIVLDVRTITEELYLKKYIKRKNARN